jgi:hypothetical protein
MAAAAAPTRHLGADRASRRQARRAARQRRQVYAVCASLTALPPPGRARHLAQPGPPERRYPGPGHPLEIHIEKGRGLHGEDAKPFEAMLDIGEGKTAWSMKDVEDATRPRVSGLPAAGISVRETAEETGIAKSVEHRLKQQIERAAKEQEVGQAEGEAR